MSEITIADVRAREILDCRGLPTVQVELGLESGARGRADVPAGRSTGQNEAVELRDGGSRFGGHGVRKAVANVEGEIAEALKGAPADQRVVDHLLIELDGTPNKARLGANAVLGVSLALARALAEQQDLPHYRNLNPDSHVLPVPQVNLINGGKHASNDLDFQEIIVMPVGVGTFMEAMELSTEVNLVLHDLLVKRYGKAAVNVGDEGGYAPPLSDPEEALSLLHEAVDKAGRSEQVVYGLDCASTHFYDAEAGTYSINGKQLDRDGMIGLYEKLVQEWGVVSMEDPLQEEDFEGFAVLTKELGIQIVGDDLFVTNPARLAQGVAVGAANALLWKVNQIGTLSEALDGANLALRSGYAVVVSERSGETEDPIIADFAVALGAGQIKTGAPVRGERTAKYNELLRIEQELGQSARYAGRSYANPALVAAE